MLYKLGRALQVAGMIILPLAIAGEIMEKITLKSFLLLSAVGVAVFFLGWWLQQAAGPPA